MVEHTTQYTYTESGGDLPGYEKSFTHYTFADEDDALCRHCGSRQREASTQERPSYPTSQWAQDGLLKLIREGMVKPMSEMVQRDGEIDELKRQVEELKALVGEQAARRGPGRPRKESTIDDTE